MQSSTARGTALRDLRKRSGLTLQELSAKAGISINYLSRAENGLVDPSDRWVAHVIQVIGEHMESGVAA